MIALLKLDGLEVGFSGPNGRRKVVNSVSAELQAAEVTALVGESGSGKTMVSRAILGLLPPGGQITGGRILFDGQDLRRMPAKELRTVRGAGIGLVLQEPLTSLNPALRIGEQMAEALKWHHGVSAAVCRRRSLDMLDRLGIHDPPGCLSKYPHEFSGGMRQRILIASVLMLRPPLLIADEPTTALDVLVQKQVLDAMIDVVREQRSAVLLITHDLALAARYADRLVVMRHGALVECGDTSEILLQPQHEYTKKLLAAMPRSSDRTVPSLSTKPLVVAEDITVRFRGRRRLPWRAAATQDAVEQVRLSVRKGEMLVVVGESGSGKSTLARAMLGLLPLATGRVEYDGVDLGGLSRTKLRRLRRRMQMVFQDPYSALDPRRTVVQTVVEGLRHVPGLNGEERRERALSILVEVGLGQEFADRFPHELSGGQRQRVNIARALVSQPEFVIADEPVSSLDITVQSEILRLFNELRERHGFSCLLITHDLGVAQQVADRVAVMRRARIVEQGSRVRVFGHPCHPYTRALMTAAPMLEAIDNAAYRLVDANFATEPLPKGYAFDDDSDEPGDRSHLRMLELTPNHFVECRKLLSPDNQEKVEINR